MREGVHCRHEPREITSVATWYAESPDKPQNRLRPYRYVRFQDSVILSSRGLEAILYIRWLRRSFRKAHESPVLPHSFDF